jgi:preprotein translocase subunit YajC
VSELKRGESVVTTSGILGTIEGITDTYVTLEIAEDVRIKILRSQILSSQAKAAEGKA